jgi:hypothetical protein
VKKAAAAILALSISLISPSCGKNTPSHEAPIALSSAQKELISDKESGFCIMDNLTLWDIGSGTPKLLSACAIGEKLALLGETARVVQSGAPRTFIRVRQSSGSEGWARAEYVVADSVLAVIADDEAVVYSQPDARTATGQTLSRMTILAIHKSTAATAFLRISCVQEEDGKLLRSVYLRNSGVSSLIDDVKSAVLYAIASRTENERKRAAFLTSALSDYPRSRFTEDIRRALQAVKEPVPEEIPTEELTASFVTGDDGINVLSLPDETAGTIVETLPKGRTVDVIEKTSRSYTIGSLSAPWYRIKNPEGWIFGVSLIPK